MFGPWRELLKISQDLKKQTLCLARLSVIADSKMERMFGQPHKPVRWPQRRPALLFVRDRVTWDHTIRGGPDQNS